VERNDGHFKQTAALKFLKGLPSAERLAFFTSERQLLAGLKHPNIAHLLDGGTSASGQPYLVMEYIDGLNIDTYCRQHRLSADAILKLFIAASDSVSFAHRQLIVHCDLKPSNILIEKEGRPVLLDFGIARLIDHIDEDRPEGATGATTSSSGFTPRYASPEQREMGRVSTASDIYSLGVLLSELLQIAGTVDDDLTAIVDYATQGNPLKRYASVDAFVDDIRRYQMRQPVQAHPAHPTYIAKKFLQRRWPLVLIAAAFMLTVAGFTAKVLIESQRALRAEQAALMERDAAGRERDVAARERDVAARERTRAQAAEQQALSERDRATGAERATLVQRNVARQERDRATGAEVAARQTNDFLVSVFDAADPNASSGDIPASTLLARAEASIERDIARSPQTQAEIYAVMGKVRRTMSEPSRSSGGRTGR
jgi:eukaryotic-like serine/threonine-protein kinase